MFIPAKELHVSDEDFGGDLVPGDYQPGRHGTYENMWQQKLDAATVMGQIVRNPHYTGHSLTTSEYEEADELDAMGESLPGRLTRDIEMTWEPKDSLQQGIKEEGITKPVKIAFAEDIATTWQALGTNPLPPSKGQQVIVDGHHRIAAAHALDPDTEIPVEYSKSTPQQDWARSEGARADKAAESNE
jgi:hypothetical protein